MNLFEGEVSDGKFVMAGAALPLPVGQNAAMAKTYGIRPEHLSIKAEGTLATVVVVEPTGSETHVLVKLGDADVTLMLRDRIELQPGQTISIATDLTKVHLFGGDGGRLN